MIFDFGSLSRKARWKDHSMEALRHAAILLVTGIVVGGLLLGAGLVFDHTANRVDSLIGGLLGGLTGGLLWNVFERPAYGGGFTTVGRIDGFAESLCIGTSLGILPGIGIGVGAVALPGTLVQRSVLGLIGSLAIGLVSNLADSGGIGFCLAARRT